MKKLILYILVLFGFWVKTEAQVFSSYESYTYTRVFLDSVTVSSNLNAAQSVQTVQYNDGLGRPRQTVSIKGINANQDIVTSFFYDSAGKQTKQYLPVPVSTGNGLLHAVSEADINSYYNMPNAYAEVADDESPLGRITKSANPGSDWSMASGRAKEFFYEFNEANTIKKYSATLNTVTFENNLSDDGYFAANTLYKNSVKDEDGNISSVYKNSLGQTIMTRVKNGTDFLDTYYVYNQYNQQVYIIPPLNPGENALNVKDEVLYQYQYDAYGRQTEKKIPGKGREYYVYDKENRLIMSTNEQLKSEGKWTFIKYDRLGRVIYTGLCSGGERSSEQSSAESSSIIYETRKTTAVFNTSALPIYYSKNAYPTTVTDVLSVNYYDEYPPAVPVTRPASIYSQPTLSSDITGSNHSTKSMLTASFVKNLEENRWNKTLFWYDTKERLVGNHKTNHLNGFTKTEMQVDFPGNITESIVEHKRSSTNQQVVVKQRYVYSPQNLLLRHYHQVDNGQEELLEEFTYDDLGRAVNKKLGNNLQSVDYSYNIRGWLTSVNNPDNLGSDLFAYKVNFNQREGEETPNNDFSHLKVKPKYNGSIAEITWASTDKKGRYGYVYDGAGRLLAGLYQDPQNPFLKEHSEIATYDRRGNVSTLKRSSAFMGTAANLIDDLQYNYTANRLDSITDLSEDANGYEGGGNTISYDDNGNMTDMRDKGIYEIGYNMLNLANSIEISEGSSTVSVTSMYGADGVKLRKKITAAVTGIKGASVVTSTADYLDGFYHLETVRKGGGAEIPGELETEVALEREAFLPDAVSLAIPGDGGGTSNAELLYFPTSAGFYDFAKKQYIYQYKDHLGNVRVSYTRNEDDEIEILDSNDYYAFGMNHLNPENESFFGIGSFKNHKYNGKELQETGMYDYGWRMYMPDIARWNGIDQLAEKFASASTYAYVMNNPVSFYDPDGRDINFTDWMNKLFRNASKNAITTFSNFDSFGNWGERSHTFYDVIGPATSFYNFLAGGGIGDFKYFSGGTYSYSNYNYSDKAYYGGIELGKLNVIRIKGFTDKISDFFKDHFVFQVEGKGTLGVQAGIGRVEGGIMTGDIGNFGWSNRKGFYANAGDGKGHNFIGVVGGVKGLGYSAKLDYVTNDIIPTEGSDLLEYYPNNGVLNTEFGVGSNYKGENLVIPNRPSIRVGRNTDANEACRYCLNASYGAKLLLGLDVSIKIGFTN
ncbi:DUF6443 domain-containing protein [Chryseobacterium koreense]|uniref:DUF6443 domain-containing protein n=1 Tax=Chryseobacterium koreense TaxID=232216 RepID=UPI00065AC3FC|nr:DUF6443 domain-containing protein [Chryseobacterium koreense]MBB5333526.1 RHS repeat-associated protein [Chryseobacterium koreense]